MFKNLKPVIAIDGTAGSGKGTLARKIARILNFDHLDTGKLYRYLAHLELKENKKILDIIKYQKKIDFSEINKLNLRTEEISNSASIIAKKKEVRDFLTEFQRNFSCFPPSGNGSVIDGRDIGSVIIPNAEVKFYVDANLEVRSKRRLKERMDVYKNLDTSNPYLNMENTMEDLTINQKQAQFQAQQFAQSQANIMGELRGAAGGSGIAALAQSLAQQGQIAAQASSASIGQQEAANQMAERQMAGNIQSMERQGEMISRGLKKEQAETLLGMEQQNFAAAKNAQARAEQARMQALTGGAAGICNVIWWSDCSWVWCL